MSKHYPTGHKWADIMRNEYEITGVYQITGGYHYHLRANGKRICDIHGNVELIPHRYVERLAGGRDSEMIDTYVTNRPKSMADALRRNQARLGTIYVATK